MINDLENVLYRLDFHQIWMNNTFSNSKPGICIIFLNQTLVMVKQVDTLLLIWAKWIRFEMSKKKPKKKKNRKMVLQYDHQLGMKREINYRRIKIVFCFVRNFWRKAAYFSVISEPRNGVRVLLMIDLVHLNLFW